MIFLSILIINYSINTIKMYFVDLTEELKQEIINKYTVHKIKKVDLRKEYGYSQKICQKIFKDIF